MYNKDLLKYNSLYIKCNLCLQTTKKLSILNGLESGSISFLLKTHFRKIILKIVSFKQVKHKWKQNIESGCWFIPQDEANVVYSRNKCSKPSAKLWAKSSAMHIGISKKSSKACFAYFISSTADCAYGSFLDFGFHVYNTI